MTARPMRPKSALGVICAEKPAAMPARRALNVSYEFASMEKSMNKKSKSVSKSTAVKGIGVAG